jgi:hypothetical protein
MWFPMQTVPLSSPQMHQNLQNVARLRTPQLAARFHEADQAEGGGFFDAVDSLAKLGIGGAVLYGGHKLLGYGKTAAAAAETGLGQALKTGAEALEAAKPTISAAATTALKTGQAVVNTGKAVVNTGAKVVNTGANVVKGGINVGKKVVSTGAKVGQAVVDTGKSVVNTGAKVGQAVVDTGKAVVDTGVKTGQAVAGGVKAVAGGAKATAQAAAQATQALENAASGAASGAKDLLVQEFGETPAQILQQAEQTVTQAVDDFGMGDLVQYTDDAFQGIGMEIVEDGGEAFFGGL